MDTNRAAFSRSRIANAICRIDSQIYDIAHRQWSFVSLVTAAKAPRMRAPAQYSLARANIVHLLTSLRRGSRYNVTQNMKKNNMSYDYVYDCFQLFDHFRYKEMTTPFF